MQTVHDKAQESADIKKGIAAFLEAGGKIQVIPRREGEDLYKSVKKATNPTYSNNEQIRKINSIEN